MARCSGRLDEEISLLQAALYTSEYESAERQFPFSSQVGYQGPPTGASRQVHLPRPIWLVPPYMTEEAENVTLKDQVKSLEATTATLNDRLTDQVGRRSSQCI